MKRRRNAAKVVARLADGVYEAESFFDNDGVTPNEACASTRRSTVEAGA